MTFISTEKDPLRSRGARRYEYGDLCSASMRALLSTLLAGGIISSTVAGGENHVLADRCDRQPLDLAVLILSRPAEAGGTAAQEAVRAAWAHWPQPCVVRHWFLIGGAAHDHVRGDMLHVTAPEGYSKIFLKVLAGMRWLLRSRAHGGQHAFRFLLKTDDDAFVCLGGVLRFLAASLPLYAGKPGGRNTTAHFKASHPFHDPSYFRTYHRTYFADYFVGAGYVLASGLVDTVVENARRLHLLRAIDTVPDTASEQHSGARDVASTRTAAAGGRTTAQAGGVPAVEDGWVGSLAREASTGLPRLPVPAGNDSHVAELRALYNAVSAHVSTAHGAAQSSSRTAPTAAPMTEHAPPPASDAIGNGLGSRSLGSGDSLVRGALRLAPHRASLLGTMGLLPAVGVRDRLHGLEVELPISRAGAQPLPSGTRSHCSSPKRAGFLMMNSLKPGDLLVCAAEVAANPPYCSIEPGPAAREFFNPTTGVQRVGRVQTAHSSTRCSCRAP